MASIRWRSFPPVPARPMDAVKAFRALADKQSALVPRPLVLLELAGLLRQFQPKGSRHDLQQIKKDYPDTPHCGSG